MRHQRFWQPLLLEGFRFPRRVLNALRHQRFWQLAYRNHLENSGGAQRLAASEVLAGGQIGHGERQPECSTPCGIRGFGSRPGTTSMEEVMCAQRLAASEVLAAERWHVGYDQEYECSTPCGIRGFGSRALPTSTSSSISCSTPCGIRGFGSSSLTSGCPDGVKCSTPCGIRGFGRSSGQRLTPVWPVLNALRHQRFWQNGQRTTRKSFSRAQRLAASEVLAEPLQQLTLNRI